MLSIRAASAEIKSEWRYNSPSPYTFITYTKKIVPLCFRLLFDIKVEVTPPNRHILLWRHWLFSLHGDFTLREISFLGAGGEWKQTLLYSSILHTEAPFSP